MHLFDMFKTIRAYRQLFKSKIVFVGLIFLFAIAVLSTSFFVFNIKSEIQGSLLSILSILFPLIAGFMTFGRDTLKNITDEIKKIKIDELNDEGESITDIDKRQLRLLKDLSSNFLNVVISTFFISFLLIIILLISMFNDFEFSTSNDIVKWIENWKFNIGILIVKIVFFYLVYTMLLNVLYVTIFIIRITKHDDK